MWRLAFVCLVAIGCVKTALVECDDGRSCPVGTLCNDRHATCVSPTQLEACDGATDGAPCTAGSLSGVCADGVCFEDVCGNLIIQPGEECDDGNFTDGDGCSASCLVEGCGNGRIDVVGDEQCDDGNSRSGDGCDSTCQLESMAWSMRMCGEPRYMNEQNTTFDAGRGVIVHVDSSSVMEWDGTSWRCFARQPDANGYTPSFPGLIYDPARQRVVGLPYNNQTLLREWDGATWTERTTTNVAPSLQRVTYDSRVNQVVGYGSDAKVWYLTLDDTPTWTSVAAIGAAPPTNYTGRVAFDHAADRLVMLREDATTTQSTWLWDRTAQQWTTGPALPIDSTTTLGYDAARQRVVAYGGRTSSTYFATLYEWTGAAWSLRSTSPSARSNVALLFDPAAQAVVIAGGSDSQRSYGDLWRLDANGWANLQQAGLLPRSPVAIVALPPAGKLFAMSQAGETFAWSGGGWERLAIDSIPIGTQAQFAYDSRRLTIVGYDPSGWYAEFDGQAWQLVETDTTPLTIRAMVYDSTKDRLLGIASDSRTYTRGPGGWTQLPTATICCVRSAAFDLRAGKPIIVTDSGPDTNTTYELADDDTAWIEVFEFGTGEFSFPDYRVVQYHPRGTVLWVDTGEDGATWERIGDLWRLSNVRPMRYTYDRVVPHAAGGELLLISTYNGGQVYGYGYTSGAPHETCEDGIDADGDGKTACEDDDCWWKCTPSCPPFATCVP